MVAEVAEVAVGFSPMAEAEAEVEAQPEAGVVSTAQHSSLTAQVEMAMVAEAKATLVVGHKPSWWLV